MVVVDKNGKSDESCPVTWSSPARNRRWRLSSVAGQQSITTDYIHNDGRTTNPSQSLGLWSVVSFTVYTCRPAVDSDHWQVSLSTASTQCDWNTRPTPYGLSDIAQDVLIPNSENGFLLLTKTHIFNSPYRCNRSS